jgi:hypothetical protein
MVLVMARLEAGPHGRLPKKVKGELENNSRNPRDTLNKVQLTLSQGKKKKGDEVANDDDDDMYGESQCVKKV